MREAIHRWFFGNKREIAFGAIVIFTALLSFGFGYLIDRTFNHVPIIIEKCSNP